MSKTSREKELAEIFKVMANPDENGFSEWVLVSELVELDEGFRTGNGCSWARSDNSCLGREFLLDRKKEKNRVVAVRTIGYNFSKKRNRTIRPDIRKHFAGCECRWCGTRSHIEIDHKNGRYDGNETDYNKQSIEDFQPLCKHCNDTKRTFCNRCKESGIRFDAKRIGFPMSYTEGDSSFKEREDGKCACTGCYLFDSDEFKKHLGFIG